MKTLSYILGLGVTLCASTQAVTILDEGFEAPKIVPQHYLMVTDHSIPGWVVNDNDIGEPSFIVDEQRFAISAPQLQFQGSQALVLNEGTTISTKISLIAGQTYNFLISGYQGPQVFDHDLEIAIGTYNTSLTFDSWKISGVHERNFTFRANESGNLDLVISNPEAGVQYRQRVIDQITITAVPDGGATAILLGLGCLGLFAMRRK